MIAKCKAIAHGGAMINYAMKEKKFDRLVARNLVLGENPDDILAEMEAVNGYNTRCRNKYLRFEIGIAPQDETKMTSQMLKCIIKEFT